MSRTFPVKLKKVPHEPVSDRNEVHKTIFKIESRLDVNEHSRILFNIVCDIRSEKIFYSPRDVTEALLHSHHVCQGQQQVHDCRCFLRKVR